MKRVGVVVRYNVFNKIEYYAIKKDVIDWIGKKAIIIPIILNNNKNVFELVKLCDGIILTGGDILCKLDYKLVVYLYKNDIPTLGICMGMQLMGLYKGGKLKKINNHYNVYHKVFFSDPSPLSSIYKRGSVVVSRHHECLINTKLKVIARDEEGIIEGVEDNKKRFFIGIQWHPESLNSKCSDKLINYFIKIL